MMTVYNKVSPFFSSKEGEIITSSKTDNSINIVEDNKENIISARKSSLPGSLPPVPSKKSRPRLASTTKDTNKSTDDTKEDSIDDQKERLSQKSLTRSHTEVYYSFYTIKIEMY